MKSNPLVDNQDEETSLMTASDESAEQPPTVAEGNNGSTDQQRAQTTDSVNPNTNSVIVLSPPKHVYLPDSPENPAGRSCACLPRCENDSWKGSIQVVTTKWSREVFLKRMSEAKSKAFV